jgi:hypothetical protein
MGTACSKLSTIEPAIQTSITTVEKIFSFIPDKTKPNILDDIDIINKKIVEEIKKKDSIIDLNTKITISQDEIHNSIKDVFEVIPSNVCIYYNSVIMCFLIKKLENDIIEFSIEENNVINHREIMSLFLFDIIFKYLSEEYNILNNHKLLNIKIPIRYFIDKHYKGILSLTINYNFIKYNEEDIEISINNKCYRYKLCKNDNNDKNAIIFKDKKYYFTPLYNTIYLIIKGELNKYTVKKYTEKKYTDNRYDEYDPSELYNEYDTWGFYTDIYFIGLLEYYYINGYIIPNLYVKYDKSIYIMNNVNGIVQLKSIFTKNKLSSDGKFTDIKIFNIIGEKLLDIQFLINTGLTLANPNINIYVNEIKRYFLRLLKENNKFNMIFHINDIFTNLLSSEFQKYKIPFEIEKIIKDNKYYHSFNFNLSNTKDLIERFSTRDSISSIESIGSIGSEVTLIESKHIKLSTIGDKKKD